MSRFILIPPSEEYLEEIHAYRQELLAYGASFHGESGLEQFEDVSGWIEQCRLLTNKETLPNPGWVEADQFMLVQEGVSRILGMINVRHDLNGYLAEYGGHIGYGIRCSEFQKGYGKTMLKLCLEHCRRIGLSKVLITCDEKNEASRRTILACGGVFERKTAEGDVTRERYLIALDSDYPTELVYGTGNPAKLRSMSHFLAPLGLRLIGLKETGLILPVVDESGNSPAENAKIKAMAYYHVLQRPVFACDSGLYIEGLKESEQPGVHVRRVGGKQLNDEEMITHYAAIAKKLGGKAAARYKNAICLVISQTERYEYSGDDISGNVFYLVDKPHPKRTAGFPLDSISVHLESGEYFYSYKQTNEVERTGIGFQNFFKRVLRIHEHDLSKK